MALQYLIFEASEDGEGQGSWEAMAGVREADLPALRSEVQAVLQAAERQSPGPRGPVDDGGCWDADLHEQQDGGWTTLTLTLTGPWDWGEALLDGLGQA